MDTENENTEWIDTHKNNNDSLPRGWLDHANN